MSIGLKNIVEYCYNSYKSINKNANINDKLININNKLTNISVELFEYDFIELNEIYDFPFNESILIYPIDIDNNSIKYLLHSILLIVDNKYFKSNNYHKKISIENIFNKYNTIDKCNEFVINFGYNLIIINNETNINYYNNNSKLFIIVVQYDNKYYPFYYNGFYNDKMKNIKHLINNSNKFKNDSIINDVDNDEFIELHTYDNDKIKIINDELIDNKILKINDVNKKNIFVNQKELLNNNIDTATFINTEINKNELINQAKMSMKINELQNLAIQLNISIQYENGSKIKNKTKQMLYDEIKTLHNKHS